MTNIRDISNFLGGGAIGAYGIGSFMPNGALIFATTFGCAIGAVALVRWLEHRE